MAGFTRVSRPSLDTRQVATLEPSNDEPGLLLRLGQFPLRLHAAGEVEERHDDLCQLA